jgi:hypothetical protein
MAATRPLVDSDAEQAVLEGLIDRVKPPLPSGMDFRGLHYLLFSPFRHPPLKHGSRFGRRSEPSLWYGSEDVRTALGETAYYRIVLFEGTKAKLAPHTLPMSAYQARIGTRAAIDVSSPVFKRHVDRICSPVDYSVSQVLGSAMREDGIDAVRYPSARAPGGMNVGLFRPEAFASKKPLRAPETWICTITAAHDVQFHHEAVAGIRRHGFPRSTFLVDGVLPRPAT